MSENAGPDGLEASEVPLTPGSSLDPDPGPAAPEAETGGAGGAGAAGGFEDAGPANSDPGD